MDEKLTLLRQPALGRNVTGPRTIGEVEWSIDPLSGGWSPDLLEVEQVTDTAGGFVTTFARDRAYRVRGLARWTQGDTRLWLPRNGQNFYLHWQTQRTPQPVDFTVYGPSLGGGATDNVLRIINSDAEIWLTVWSVPVGVPLPA